MPKISIIVPVYNSAPYLVRCFESLAGQSMRDIEVLVVLDDGSRDRSAEIIDAYVAKAGGVFRSFTISHVGLGEARNYGLAFAKGEFVAFVDSDDYVEKSFCENPLHAAERSGADIVCFSARVIDEYHGTERIVGPGVRQGMGPRQALLGATVTAWDKLYRRSFLDRCAIRYPPFFHEDISETPRLFANEPRVAVLDETLYNYVKRSDSASGFSINIRDMDTLPICRLLLNHATQYPLYASEFELMAMRRLRDFCEACAACPEEWAKQGLREAKDLLGSLRDKQSDNPYFMIEAAENPGFKLAFARMLRASRKSIVRRLRAHPRIFIPLKRLLTQSGKI